MCIYLPAGQLKRCARSCTRGHTGWQVSAPCTRNNKASRVRLSFGSKPWLWSLLQHPQGAERIKDQPFPAHRLLPEALQSLLHHLPSLCTISPVPSPLGQVRSPRLTGWEHFASWCSSAVADPAEHTLQRPFSHNRLPTFCVSSFLKHYPSASKDRPTAFINPTDIHL